MANAPADDAMAMPYRKANASKGRCFDRAKMREGTDRAVYVVVKAMFPRGVGAISRSTCVFWLVDVFIADPMRRKGRLSAAEPRCFLFNFGLRSALYSAVTIQAVSPYRPHTRIALESEPISHLTSHYRDLERRHDPGPISRCLM